VYFALLFTAHVAKEERVSLPIMAYAVRRYLPTTIHRRNASSISGSRVRVVKIWNSLPTIMEDFASIRKFKSFIERVDLPDMVCKFLMCCKTGRKINNN